MLRGGGIEGGRRRFGPWGWEGEGSRQRSGSLLNLKPWLSMTVEELWSMAYSFIN